MASRAIPKPCMSSTSPELAGFEEVTKDMSVGALAYVSVPLADVGKLDPFSPEFQSLVTDKGGIILNMLRWVIGEEAFDKTMRTFLSQYSRASRPRLTTFAKSRNRPPGSSSTGSLPNGSTPPARPSSRTNTPSIARRKASAWSARSSRTWTCSACRWS